MHILHQSRIVIVMAKRLYPSNFRHYAIMHEPTAVLSTAKHCGPINEKLAFVKLFAFCIIIIIIRDFNLILHAQALSKSKKRKKKLDPEHRMKNIKIRKFILFRMHFTRGDFK